MEVARYLQAADLPITCEDMVDSDRFDLSDLLKVVNKYEITLKIRG